MSQIDRKLSSTVLAEFVAAGRWQSSKIFEDVDGSEFTKSLRELASHAYAKLSPHLLFGIAEFLQFAG